MSTDWDAEAATFDDAPDHGLHDPEVRDAWAALLHEEVPPRSDVVDLGCGTGSLAVLLAGQGHRVRALDLSPAMVARARVKVEGLDVAVDVGDAMDPVVEGPVDVVLARHVLWALPDPVAALRRWAGLLRPGGRLVLVEGCWSTGAGLAAETLRLLAEEAYDAVEVLPLSDQDALWGGPVSDERYLLRAVRR
ncbi:MAG: 27-O-demethylrifamycin methyltransferase [Frankiales bacterium]|nr:27-O-demethylrifamycin methyltransferase [Frankiales bacterium]